MIPPQGIGGVGGGLIDADAVEDSYIAKFKALDPKVARVFGNAELLVDVGLLSIDDVARYCSSVLSASVIANYCEKLFSTSFYIQLFLNSNLTAAKAASILSDTNMSTNRAQSILYYMVDNGYYDRLLDILTVNAPNASYTSNITLSTGVNVYRNLNVGSSVTLTLGAGPAVIIANTITNNGTITSGWVKATGGAGGAVGAGSGGNGTGGLIILARNITTGTIKADGGAGESGSTVGSSASGKAGAAGLFWTIGSDTVPSGGNGGGSYAGVGRPNGGGGGGYNNSFVGGNGGNASTTSFTDELSLLKELLKATADWWLVNVANRSPTSTKSFPSFGGSSGGGGAAVDMYCANGGGGGGAGEIIIYGTSVTAGTVTAIGGAGGNGGIEGIADSGGGGGGGGVIYVLYKTLSGTFSFNVSGGAAGIGDYNGSAGGTGVARTIVV
jgi:hypothetical protein